MTATPRKGRLPAMMFYVGDWLKDPGLRAVSFAARGLWADMLCLMFDSPTRGVLRHPTGKAVSPEQIARMTGGSRDEVQGLLSELEECGVYSTTEDGAIFSRRMVRDEQARAERAARGAEFGHLGAEHGAKGAEFGHLGGRGKTRDNPGSNGGDSGGNSPPQEPGQNPLLSYSSSTSISSSVSGSIPPSGEEGDATASRRSRSRVFTPPTPSQVAEFCTQHNLSRVDQEAWFGHYIANGWKIGRNSMKSWEACLRTWDRRTTQQATTVPSRRSGGFRGDFLQDFAVEEVAT